MPSKLETQLGRYMWKLTYRNPNLINIINIKRLKFEQNLS